MWGEWMCKTFKDRPIETVELGEVSTDKEDRPAVPYKLVLTDGTVLEGDLPFEYRARGQYWLAVHGLDWYLKYKSGLTQQKKGSR